MNAVDSEVLKAAAAARRARPPQAVASTPIRDPARDAESASLRASARLMVELDEVKAALAEEKTECRVHCARADAAEASLAAIQDGLSQAIQRATTAEASIQAERELRIRAETACEAECNQRKAMEATLAYERQAMAQRPEPVAQPAPVPVVQAPAAAPAVKGWSIDVVARDGANGIRKIKMTPEY